MSSGPDPRSLADATTDELRARLASGGAVALLPIGSTEAHGPHLPLATDVVIAEAAARRAASEIERRGRTCFVLPALPYAVTEFVAEFPGTISVRAAVVAELIQDVARSALRQGFSRVVLVNGHLEPEHARMLKDVAKSLSGESGLDVVFADQRRPPVVEKLGREFGEGGGHAGGYETSLVMAARPDLVRDDLRRLLPPNPCDIAARLKSGAKSASEIGGDRAYFGFPAAATMEEGERLLSVLAAMIVEAALSPSAPSAPSAAAVSRDPAGGGRT